MKHVDIRNIMEDAALVGTELTVCGWVRTARDSKNMAFVELNDGTTLKHLQIVVDKATLTPPDAATHLGAALRVKGTVGKSPSQPVCFLEVSDYEKAS